MLGPNRKAILSLNDLVDEMRKRNDIPRDEKEVLLYFMLEYKIKMNDDEEVLNEGISKTKEHELIINGVLQELPTVLMKKKKDKLVIKYLAKFKKFSKWIEESILRNSKCDSLIEAFNNMEKRKSDKQQNKQHDVCAVGEQNECLLNSFKVISSLLGMPEFYIGLRQFVAEFGCNWGRQKILYIVDKVNKLVRRESSWKLNIGGKKTNLLNRFATNSFTFFPGIYLCSVMTHCNRVHLFVVYKPNNFGLTMVYPCYSRDAPSEIFCESWWKFNIRTWRSIHYVSKTTQLKTTKK